jgi:hypothetical protein
MWTEKGHYILHQYLIFSPLKIVEAGAVTLHKDTFCSRILGAAPVRFNPFKVIL